MAKKVLWVVFVVLTVFIWGPAWLWWKSITFAPMRYFYRRARAKQGRRWLAVILSICMFGESAGVWLGTAGAVTATGLVIYYRDKDTRPVEDVMLAAIEEVADWFDVAPTSDIVQQARKFRLDEQTIFYGHTGPLDGSEYVVMGEAGTRREFIPFAKINPLFIKTLITIEDERFYMNPGIDARGILRAAYTNARTGSFKQGASTLTQQWVKNVTQDKERTGARKLREILTAALARRQEEYSPNEMLEFLLNYHDFGSGIYGIQAESKYLFGKDQSVLGIEEVAMIIRRFKGTLDYNPCAKPKKKGEAPELTTACKKTGCSETKLQAAERGRLTVLKRMWEENTGVFATTEDYERAKEPLEYTCVWPRTETSVSYGPQYAMKEFSDRFSVQGANDGRNVYMTLHREVQLAAENSVRGVVGRLNEEFPTSDIEAGKKKVSPVEGAMVVLSVKDRRVWALVGGTGRGDGNFDRATQMCRQPGSTFKLGVYARAFQDGYVPEDTCRDELKSYGSWTPNNHDDKYHGEITLEEAFARSSNPCAAALTSSVGVGRVNVMIRALGVNTPQPDVLTTSIGGAGCVTPLELTNMFATVANNGVPQSPWSNERVTTKKKPEKEDEGKGEYEEYTYSPEKDGPPVIDLDVVQDLRSLGKSVIMHPSGTGRYLQTVVDEGYELSCKTGTTNDYRDAYVCCSTPEIVWCVWLGRDSNHPIGKGQGSGQAVRVSAAFFEDIKHLLSRPDADQIIAVTATIAATTTASPELPEDVMDDEEAADDVEEDVDPKDNF